MKSIINRHICKHHHRCCLICNIAQYWFLQSRINNLFRLFSSAGDVVLTGLWYRVLHDIVSSTGVSKHSKSGTTSENMWRVHPMSHPLSLSLVHCISPSPSVIQNIQYITLRISSCDFNIQMFMLVYPRGYVVSTSTCMIKVIMTSVSLPNSHAPETIQSNTTRSTLWPCAKSSEASRRVTWCSVDVQILSLGLCTTSEVVWRAQFHKALAWEPYATIVVVCAQTIELDTGKCY